MSFRHFLAHVGAPLAAALVIAALLLAACAGQPSPAPTATPTSVPRASASLAWARPPLPRGAVFALRSPGPRWRVVGSRPLPMTWSRWRLGWRHESLLPWRHPRIRPRRW